MLLPHDNSRARIDSTEKNQTKDQDAKPGDNRVAHRERTGGIPSVVATPKQPEHHQYDPDNNPDCHDNSPGEVLGNELGSD